VKRYSADGSVGSPHVRVGHRQAPYIEPQSSDRLGFFRFKRLKGAGLFRAMLLKREVLEVETPCFRSK
ncbi:hypothetical protein, partial [Oceanospirillum multiglobuliferum]|uniref:hypothetical protein n=1 Tax=Oceanospirillum multiglobuliferum TaxID=64969 RepID=UPI001B7FF335